MKSVTVLITDWCPHCKRAIDWIDEVKQKQYDYYYVPTYFVEKRKIFEGGTTKDIVRKVFEEAIKTDI
ncbi:MAG: Thioredoxin protein [Anaerospora sp.]|nr:Thioredoxin protein [Anaerospora sp.]